MVLVVPLVLLAVLLLDLRVVFTLLCMQERMEVVVPLVPPLLGIQTLRGQPRELDWEQSHDQIWICS